MDVNEAGERTSAEMAGITRAAQYGREALGENETSHRIGAWWQPPGPMELLLPATKGDVLAILARLDRIEAGIAEIQEGPGDTAPPERAVSEAVKFDPDLIQRIAVKLGLAVAEK